VPDEPLALDFHRTTARVALILVLFTDFLHILNDLVRSKHSIDANGFDFR
jgi:hypothetical protein